MLKSTVESWVAAAMDALGKREEDTAIPIQVERPAQRAHGDYASNAALMLASRLKRNPRELAAELKQQLPQHALLERVEIAGPGFLNFFLHTDALRAEIARILAQGHDYGRASFGEGHRVLLEFVSANPTGPLHVGHGRGAACGDILARLLQACGYQVEREYYVNDCGLQAEILGLSVLLRKLQRDGAPVPDFPEGAYQGAYIEELAAQLPPTTAAALTAIGTWPPMPADADPQTILERLLHHARQALGKHYTTLCAYAMDTILTGIRSELLRMGIQFDHWMHESTLRHGGLVADGIARLEQAGHVYRQDGAQWFRATTFGDEKDRVLVRDNGAPTYFAADVAYHAEKYRRGYDLMLNVWGADHHGYIPRLRAALQALGLEDQRLEIHLVQFVALWRGKTRLSMSTRQGLYVTLQELQQEVGTAPARYTYITRNSNQHLEFDLELAKSTGNDNPVYYVQYAHARICSILRKAEATAADRDLDALNAIGGAGMEEERALMSELAAYPETVEAAGRQREPHLLAYYLQTLAGSFHTYYNHCQILAEEERLRKGRLLLAWAVRRVLANGLELIGIEAPERM